MLSPLVTQRWDRTQEVFTTGLQGAFQCLFPRGCEGRDTHSWSQVPGPGQLFLRNWPCSPLCFPSLYLWHCLLTAFLYMGFVLLAPHSNDSLLCFFGCLITQRSS